MWNSQPEGIIRIELQIISSAFQMIVLLGSRHCLLSGGTLADVMVQYVNYVMNDTLKKGAWSN